MPAHSANRKPSRQSLAAQQAAAKQERTAAAFVQARETPDPGSAQTQASDALWKDMTAVNEELFAFGQSRLQVNLERSQSLLHCRDLEQAYQMQSDFVSSAARQYIDESGRLMRLMTKVMLDCWTPAGR